MNFRRPQGATSGLTVGGEETSVTHCLNNNGLLGLGLHSQLPDTFSSSQPHQHMASKIFCCCCNSVASESTLNTAASCLVPTKSQQHHPRPLSKSTLGTMGIRLSYFLGTQSPQPLLAGTLSLRLCRCRRGIVTQPVTKPSTDNIRYLILVSGS